MVNEFIGGIEESNKKIVKFKIDDNPPINIIRYSMLFDDTLAVFDTTQENYSVLINQMKKGNKIKIVIPNYDYRNIFRSTDLHGFIRSFNKIK